MSVELQLIQTILGLVLANFSTTIALAWKLSKTNERIARIEGKLSAMGVDCDNSQVRGNKN